MNKTALVVGATGLIGSQLLDLLLQDSYYERVVALARKPLPPHPKLTVWQSDFSNLNPFTLPGIHDVFCCLGTTIKTAGSKDAFRKVDFDYPVAVAEWALRQGANQYLIVTALGADARSRIFYNRVKGEVEQKVQQIGYRSVHVFRPSLLLGPRKESRSGEDAAKQFNRWFGWLLPDSYRGIESSKVAHAMQHWAKQNVPGTHVHESKELQAF
jgi:uncharacterized protein YbjT (DUF2867 family)